MTSTLLAVGGCTAAAILLLSVTATSRTLRRTVAACPSPQMRRGQDGTWGVGLTKSQAEELLDWLEAHGRKGKLTFVSGQGFHVC